MQPLISVEHESRQNAHRGEQSERRPSEYTPLLRFPQHELPRANRTTVTIVLLLLLLLFAGVGIGSYLLALQSESENILPPVQFPLQLEKRSISEQHSWTETGEPEDPSPSPKAKRVIVVQTDTKQCFTAATCTQLLHDLQLSKNSTLPYNFLVSSGGQTLTALGCHQESPLFPEYPNSSLVIAFIGNFTEVPPNRKQIDAAKNLLSESVSQQYLDPSFIIIGKNSRFSPTQLFRVMNELP